MLENQQPVIDQDLDQRNDDHSQNEEELLRRKGVLWSSSPQALLDATIFINAVEKDLKVALYICLTHKSLCPKGRPIEES